MFNILRGNPLRSGGNEYRGRQRLPYSGFCCCSMYWRITAMGAPPQVSTQNFDTQYLKLLADAPACDWTGESVRFDCSVNNVPGHQGELFGLRWVRMP